MRDKYLFIPSNSLASEGHKALCSRMTLLFAMNKAGRKIDANNAQVTVAFDLTALAIGESAHPALHRYERTHLRIGDWSSLCRLISQRFPETIRLEQTGNSVQVVGVVNGVDSRIGMIFLEESRFTRARGIGNVNGREIWERRNDPGGRHYIQLPRSDSFVRRFVMRGLNGFDAMRLTRNEPLLPPVRTGPGALTQEMSVPFVNAPPTFKHPVAENTALSPEQQVLSHTRGWAKRYISTGVSNRPALSTRGAPFKSIYGAVTIDLAYVPHEQIVDLHTPRAADQYFRAQASDVLIREHHTGGNDIGEQSYLGMRDVLRTRELLVSGNLPVASILAKPEHRLLVGIRSQGSSLHNKRQALIERLPRIIKLGIVACEHLTFVDPNSQRKWHFILSSNAHAALVLFNFLEVSRDDKVIFNAYSPLRPAGMV